MISRFPSVQGLALGVSLSLHAADPGTFRDDKLPGIARAMREFVDRGEIAGAVTLVERRGVVHAGVEGYRDLAARVPLRRDDLFWIASMTKPLAGVAVLMLQDAGRLSVDDPVEKHLPEFKGQWKVVEQSSDRRVLGRPARPITLRDLLTHTSGIGDVAAARPHASLAELVAGYAREPLQFEPGSKWSYSNPGINTLGRVVEVVAGVPVEDFYETRIFRPLGMKDTTFWPSASQQRRLAKSYKKDATGRLVETPVYFVQGELGDRRRTPLPAGGLFSTADDVARLYRMMLDGGVSRGKRLLSAGAVGELTRTQTGDIRTGFVEGMSWGLGFQVVKTPTGVTAALSPGTFGHGGAYATQSWGDPVTGTVSVLMFQRAGLPNGDASDVRRAFHLAVSEALE